MRYILLLIPLSLIIVYMGVAVKKPVTLKKTLLQTVSPTQSKYLEVVATGLTVPWEIGVLPSGDMLITERAGRLILIEKNKRTIIEIGGVTETSEGGLLGLAVHPQFAVNHYIYLYLTAEDRTGIINRVERYVLQNNTLSKREVILENIKGSANHDGGRIAFGPDGYLYITTGDAQNPNLAQDTRSLNGKILRVKDNGGIPRDNPFNNEVYSYGHRNPQGLAWDMQGNLWETEHGPSGIQTGYDEVNRIVKGGNYGWPILHGDQKKEGMISPVLQSGSADTWAPAGLIYQNGSLFFTGLRGEAIYEVKLSNKDITKFVTHYKNEFGRLRAIIVGADNHIYFSTSNRDGRGKAQKEDDRIIKLNFNSINNK